MVGRLVERPAFLNPIEMKLKKEYGAVEIKSLGIKLTQDSTEQEIKDVLKHAPHLSQFIDGATTKPKTDGKTTK